MCNNLHEQNLDRGELEKEFLWAILPQWSNQNTPKGWAENLLSNIDRWLSNQDFCYWIQGDWVSSSRLIPPCPASSHPARPSYLILDWAYLFGICETMAGNITARWTISHN